MRTGGHPASMPAETVPLVLRAGQIVLADWRGDAMPKEPNKRRPAVVVEDDGLFAPNYPNAILVPLTEDSALAIPDISVAIAPTAENGCSKPCWAVSHLAARPPKRASRSRHPVSHQSSLPPSVIRSPSPSASNDRFGFRRPQPSGTD
jgi:mRNA-degrading endonuclease toxin of MazEF toxin-antitoxin module